MAIRDVAGCAQVVRRGYDDASLALDRLEKHRGDGLVDRSIERGGVTVRDPGDVTGQWLERRSVRLLRGECERAHRPPVERSFRHDDAGTPGAPGRLERRFVGLG